MKEFVLDPYLSVTLGVIVFYTGEFFYSQSNFLKKYSFPPAVVGGLFYAIILSFLNYTNIATVKLDTTLQSFFTNFFFTTIGATTSLRTLKKMGRSTIVLLILTTILLTSQNFLSVFIGKLFDLPKLLALSTGSIPLVGGHGTSFAFGSEIEKMGVANATSISLSAATFGLVFGSLLGGPLGSFLIKKHKLSPDDKSAFEAEAMDTDPNDTPSSLLFRSFMLILFSMGFGSLISIKLKEHGIVLPSYVGSMLMAAALKNLLEVYRKEHFEIIYIEKLGTIALSIFLSMALVSIQILDLVDLAIPMLTILITQVLFIALFAYFIVFRALGKTYDAAVMVAGLCGFGLGATPTAMANMSVLNDRYGISHKAMLVVPMVGALFIDFINSIVITIFINM